MNDHNNGDHFFLKSGNLLFQLTDSKAATFLLVQLYAKPTQFKANNFLHTYVSHSARRYSGLFRSFSLIVYETNFTGNVKVLRVVLYSKCLRENSLRVLWAFSRDVLMTSWWTLVQCKVANFVQHARIIVSLIRYSQRHYSASDAKYLSTKVPKYVLKNTFIQYLWHHCVLQIRTELSDCMSFQHAFMLFAACDDV